MVPAGSPTRTPSPPSKSFLSPRLCLKLPSCLLPARHGSSCLQCSVGRKQLARNTLVSCFMWVWLIPLASLGRILSLTCEDHDLRLVGIRTVLWLGLEPLKTSLSSLPVNSLGWETHQPSFCLCGLLRASSWMAAYFSVSQIVFSVMPSLGFPSHSLPPPFPSSSLTLPLPSPNSPVSLLTLLFSFSFPTQGLSL